MNKFKAWILLVICNLFWAGNYVFGKFVVAEISPVWITFTRWLGASIILLFVAYYLEKPKWRSVFKVWPNLLILAATGIIGYNLILYSALEYTSSTNAALISALNPSVIVIGSFLLFKEKMTKFQAAGLAVSLLGVCIILTRGSLTALLSIEYNRGDLLMLVAVVMWTIYTILGRRLTSVKPITATAIAALIATIIMAPFALRQGLDFGGISKLAVIGVIYMVLFPSVGSFVFWNISVQEIGANQAGVFLNLIPVFTAIISWSLGERITGAQILGGLFVFAGVYLTTGLLEKKMTVGIKEVDWSKRQ